MTRLKTPEEVATDQAAKRADALAKYGDVTLAEIMMELKEVRELLSRIQSDAEPEWRRARALQQAAQESPNRPFFG